MIDTDKLADSLIAHEGQKRYVYDDATGLPIIKGYTVQGNPTIGIGRLLTMAKGITYPELMYLFSNDIKGVVQSAQNEAWWEFVADNDARARAMCELLFNIGINRLSGFVNMLSRLKRRDYDGAAVELLNSRYADQVGKKEGQRAWKLARQLKTGSDT